MKIETLEKLLIKQEEKLKELEEIFNKKLQTHPRVGHGGTPNIIDNSKGRRMIRVVERHEEGERAAYRNIEEQKEKIKRTQRKIEAVKNKRTGQTKASIKFLEKNAIHPILLKMAEDGVVVQWKNNPQYFFVAGLKKIALVTVGGNIQISIRYLATPEEKIFCRDLINKYLKKEDK